MQNILSVDATAMLDAPVAVDYPTLMLQTILWMVLVGFIFVHRRKS